ncbi:MAG TPA: DUF1707 domain-containing protein [Gemmatimonadales bacterium]
MSEPVEPGSLRAGNADRERVVALLNGAFAEGRLDVRELDERVAAAYAAKTMGELAPLTADLPVSRSPARRPASAPATPDREIERSASRAAVGGALGLFLVNVLIWAAVSLSTGEWIYFWPIWTAIPFVFAVMAVASQRNRDRRRDG